MATYTPISGITPQYSTTNNELASGYYLKFYKSGTTTPLSVATDSAGGTLLAKVKLNPLGMPISNPLDDNTIFIPHVSENYRVVLYVNETDADNNTTASAVFNIDGLAPDIAPSGDAADITLRDTNIERQDDYDRSPLFVSGTDFTAGAGPHTITVPSGWDPTNVDFRVYRLDASDIVTVLTPTAETTTTFTLAETLLSTDVIYIGDDEFRNQMDGDPADIRSRLAVYSKTEGDARYLEESKNLSEIATAGATAQGNARDNLGGLYLRSNHLSEIATDGLTAQKDARTNINANKELTDVNVVFSGTATSVDLDTVTGGYPGNGLYLIKYNRGTTDAKHLVHIDGTYMTSVATFSDSSGGIATVVEATPGNVVTVTNVFVTGGTASVDILEIAKLG